MQRVFTYLHGLPEAHSLAPQALSMAPRPVAEGLRAYGPTGLHVLYLIGDGPSVKLLWYGLEIIVRLKHYSIT